MITGGGSPSYPSQTESERKLTEAEIKEIEARSGRVAEVAGEGERKSPLLTGIGKKKRDITPIKREKERAVTPEIKNLSIEQAQKKSTDINNKIKELEATARGSESKIERDWAQQQLDKLKPQQGELEARIGGESKYKVVEEGKPTYELENIPERERLDPNSPYYDQLYAQLQTAQGKFNEEIEGIARVLDISEDKVKDLIGKYNDYDTTTQESIRKLTGYTDEQAQLLSNQINKLSTAQTESEKTRQLAETGIQGALSGQIPDWLKQQVNEAINTEKERLSRFGATSGRIPEMESRIKLSAIPELLKIYEPISTQRYAITSGLGKDISGLGQTKLTNRYNLEGTGEMFKKQSVAQWANIPQLYTGIAKGRESLAENRLRQANAFNILQQQRLADLERYANLGA